MGSPVVGKSIPGALSGETGLPLGGLFEWDVVMVNCGRADSGAMADDVENELIEQIALAKR